MDQLELFDDNPAYDQFVDKFKPKKTTDDCYTPALVFDAVLGWACAEYGFEPTAIVRPFFPGRDYEAADYPEGCVVLDNPPFSILSQILRFFETKSIRYFLFAPALTLFSAANSGLSRCYLATGADVIYENGAAVRTSFITNLDTALVRSAPDLREAVETASKQVQREKKTAPPPKYEYPDEIITAAMVQRWSRYGIDYRLARTDAVFVRALQAQRAKGKSIFGGGFLLAERAAVERAAVERWPLAYEERVIVARLSGKPDPALPDDGQGSLFP